MYQTRIITCRETVKSGKGHFVSEFLLYVDYTVYVFQKKNSEVVVIDLDDDNDIVEVYIQHVVIIYIVIFMIMIHIYLFEYSNLSVLHSVCCVRKAFSIYTNH